MAFVVQKNVIGIEKLTRRLHGPRRRQRKNLPHRLDGIVKIVEAVFALLDGDFATFSDAIDKTIEKAL